MTIQINNDVIDTGEPQVVTERKRQLLKSKSVLDKHTSHGVSIEIAGDDIDYPLVAFQWVVKNSVMYKLPAATIEVERAGEQSWESGAVPNDWLFWSFPMGRIKRWDSGRGEYVHERDGAVDSLYVKFNAERDNCLLTTMAAIIGEDETTPRHTGRKNDSWMKLDFDHPAVCDGLDDAGRFIDDFVADNRPSVAVYQNR